MAGITSPLPRPVGSTQVLRFQGTLTPGQALATYPKTPGTWSSDALPLSTIHVLRIPLYDTGAPDDATKRLPAFVFDNTAPAGVSPVAPAASGTPASSADILNPTDLDLSDQAWAQNVYVDIQPTDAVTASEPLVPFAAQFKVCVDAVNSGFGGTTQLPVLCLALDLGAQPPQSLHVIITVEVRHTASR